MTVDLAGAEQEPGIEPKNLTGELEDIKEEEDTDDELAEIYEKDFDVDTSIDEDVNAPETWKKIINQFDEWPGTIEDLKDQLEELTVTKIDAIAAEIDKITGFSKGTDHKDLAFGAGHKSKEKRIKEFAEIFHRLAHHFEIPRFVDEGLSAEQARVTLHQAVFANLSPDKAKRFKEVSGVDLTDATQARRGIEDLYTKIRDSGESNTKKSGEMAALARQVKAAFRNKGELNMHSKARADKRPELLKNEILRYLDKYNKKKQAPEPPK